jgi:hypothetical protein
MERFGDERTQRTCTAPCIAMERAVDVIGPVLELGMSGRGMQKVAKEMGCPS